MRGAAKCDNRCELQNSVNHGPQGRSKFHNLRRIFDVSNAFQRRGRVGAWLAVPKSGKGWAAPRP